MRKKKKTNTGAKKGLEKKLKYFKERDLDREYGITLGQALNLAVESCNSFEELKDEVEERAKFFFRKSLKLRLDKDLRKLFVEYHKRKDKLTD